jgi:5-methylcytosine-specific restriction enzyme subunit McrC
MKGNVVRVFEHQRLYVGERGFEERHFKKLVQYNEKNGNKFFTVGHEKITFTSYVGVIQVGSVIIEVLPKADDEPENANSQSKWQRALIIMLRECKLIKVQSLTSATLQLTHSSNLLDLYLESFVNEVSELVHQGLVRKYVIVKDHKSRALKGKLLVTDNVKRNPIHKQRFSISSSIYSRDNILNQIIKRALDFIPTITSNESVSSKARNLHLNFSSLNDIEISDDTFDRIQLDRKTLPYKYTLSLARLILRNYSPNVRSGSTDVLAILFDMNRLFEKFVYQRLAQEELYFNKSKLTISGQTSRNFWQGQTIRPDIVLTFLRDGKVVKAVIDTKWKVMRYSYPSDADLKQIFAYNIHFKSNHSVLFYPASGLPNTDKAPFHSSEALADYEHNCQMYFADIFNNEGKVDNNFARSFINDVFKIDV